MSSKHKAKKMEQLSGMIVQSLAASIQSLEPIDEICDMLVESAGYRKALYAWKDPCTGLNLLQLAVVSKHLEVVKMFCMEKHKGSFRQTWHGDYYNPLLHLACKVGALAIIRYLVEEQGADLTAEGIVTYPEPTDSHISSQSDPIVLNSAEIHVFMNRSQRNYLSLQGDHEHDISYGDGHSSFLQEDREIASGLHQRRSLSTGLPTKSLAGPSKSHSYPNTTRRSIPTVSQGSVSEASAKLGNVKLNDPAASTTCESACSLPKESKQFIGQTPYQICVAEGHIVCANYLCLLIINRMEKPIYHIHESPLLHKVSYLGCAKHVQLLLQVGHRKHINDKDHQGHMPIHIASLTANPECIEVLLQNGAAVNCRADHRTCLQIMYWSKFRPENFVLCSEILVRYAMDANAMDHNNNTALDYLAWELGQKWYQISKAWVKTHRIAEINNYLQPAAHLREHILTDDQFRQEIFCCMQVLLTAGASTQIVSRDARVDHTIVHTLLQNTGWPLNSSLRKRPMEVYKALDLFFHYGADPNVIARNNNESAMTMLLMHSLHEIPNNLKVKFVALFLMNGANLECLIPEPKQYRENYSDRRWNIYPVMVALQERHPIDVVKLLYDFMSLRHVYRSLRMTEDKFLWHRMTWSLGGAAKDNRYREQWLAIRIPRVRSLRHCCKLAVFKAIGRRAVLIDELPLPRPLKLYLQDTES